MWDGGSCSTHEIDDEYSVAVIGIVLQDQGINWRIMVKQTNLEETVYQVAHKGVVHLGNGPPVLMNGG